MHKNPFTFRHLAQTTFFSDWFEHGVTYYTDLNYLTKPSTSAERLINTYSAIFALLRNLAFNASGLNDVPSVT